MLSLVTSRFTGQAFITRTLGVVAGVMSGVTLGALGVVLAARVLDWAAHWSDPLLGFSGVIRMLLHAGELSLLGALGGGIGGNVGGLLYRVRGLGTALGQTSGLIAGAIGGVIGGTIS